MLNFDKQSTVLKFEQIRDELQRNIENGYFKSKTLLPSISDLGIKYGFSRVTVDRAYKHLKAKGLINYVAGKGYYVSESKTKLKVLLVFNKLSYFKKNIYYGFLEALNEQAKVDLQIHHYDIRILDEILTENVDKYNYLVIMPHFNIDVKEEDFMKVLEKVPKDKLLILDKPILNFDNYLGSVYQDFENDIFSALISVKILFKKYQRLKLVIPAYSNHPLEIAEGARRFCDQYNKDFTVLEGVEDEVIEKGTAYIVVEEAELAELIKKVRYSKLKVGLDVGLISFNETILKELLDITVFTTDFDNMGKSLGEMIINQNFLNIKNPFSIIRRKSF